MSAQADCAPLQLLVVHVSRQVNHLPVADGVLPPARQDCVQIHFALHEDLILIAISCCSCCCCCGTCVPSSCKATRPAYTLRLLVHKPENIQLSRAQGFPATWPDKRQST